MHAAGIELGAHHFMNRATVKGRIVSERVGHRISLERFTKCGGVGATTPHGLAGEALLRGAGAAVAKSALLLSVSVQPLAARRSASVVLGVGAAPAPSK